MDHFEKLKRQVQRYIFLLGSLTVFLMVAGSWEARRIYPNHDTDISIILLVVGFAAVWLVAIILADYSLKPLDIVWRAILHVTPDHADVTPPNLDENKIGQELVKTLAMQVYQLASTSDQQAKDKAKTEVSQLIIKNSLYNLPLPVFALDKNQVIVFANEAAGLYLDRPINALVKESFYSCLDLSFSDDNTLDSWLQDCRANKAKDNHSWQRIRLKLADQKTLRQFDMAASYSKDNPAGIETIVTLFDQTGKYGNEDSSLDFIALTVHELRTPLTALRGYIEVFEEELDGKLDPELAGFMKQMQAAAQQLTAFVSNVLNVARVQEGELAIQLHEENWGLLIREAVNNLALAAKIHDKVINYQIDADVPTVAVDKTSITEVINNLVDNAIKYSGKTKVINIHSSVGQNGMVETTVQDDGLGIPEAVVPTLFEKFHRNYHNQARIGGTGLGLYLCSALVKAHGGNIWVKSKEGQGTTIGFTLQPYSQVAGSVQNSDNKDIVRNAHGWIKNHSLYRR